MALKWVVQQGHAAITTTENIAHMRGNNDIFGWELSQPEMDRLSKMDPPQGWLDNIVGELCML